MQAFLSFAYVLKMKTNKFIQLYELLSMGFWCFVIAEVIPNEEHLFGKLLFSTRLI